MSDEIVLDLETQKSFQEVGSRHNHHLLGISVVGVYSYRDDSWRTFEESELDKLEALLLTTRRIIGFNIKGFDLPVLAPYLNTPIHTLPVLDLMSAVEQTLGFRMSLANLVAHTIGGAKSASGLDALQWWKEGKLDLIKEYCLQDVRVTRDLYEFGKKSGHIFCQTRDGRTVKIPVAWQSPAQSGQTINPYVQQGIFS
jgi:DEAD/DEAH box helicase domain-containing protein